MSNLRLVVDNTTYMLLMLPSASEVTVYVYDGCIRLCMMYMNSTSV